MPFLAVFATATQIDLCIDTSVFQERDAGSCKSGIETDAKTAIAIKEYRIVSISFQVFLISKEHRNHDTVFTGEECLFRYKVIGVEFYFRSAVELVRILIHVIFINSARSSERGEYKETFFVVFRAAKTDGT